MPQSILYSALRSFVIALFSMTGVCLGIIPVILIFSLLFSSSESELETKYNLEILPNAEGVRKKESKDAPVILTVNITGVIGAEGLTQKDVREMLVESREGTLKNNRVKAVLLIIESPGGTVIDADGIYHALKSYKEAYKVPIYAYVDGLCASGGMYVAAAADKIFSSDASIIGSVGVIASSFMNFSKLIEKIGVQSLTLYAGKGKDDLNPFRPWKPNEQEPLQSIITYYYHDFINILTSNRPQLNKEKLIEEYGANVFPAPKAAEYGYIDASGYSRDQTLKVLLKEIGIEDDYYQVVRLNNTNWLTSLFSSEYNLFKGKVVHEVKIPGALDEALQGKFLYLYRE